MFIFLVLSFFTVVLSVIMLNAISISVIVFNVMAPFLVLRKEATKMKNKI